MGSWDFSDKDREKEEFLFVIKNKIRKELLAKKTQAKKTLTWQTYKRLDNRDMKTTTLLFNNLIE